MKYSISNFYCVQRLGMVSCVFNNENLIEQRIVVVKDMFDVENKVRQSFKRIEWCEIRCNYGIAIF